MTLMILGLALWWASHLFPIYLAERRASVIARLGEGPYKGLFAATSLAAVVLMVIGYRQADFVALWTPPGWTTHLNNLLMVLAIFVIDAKHFNSSVKHYVRHPMLTGVKLWAIAHLAANGDLASILLFGGLLAWAVVAVIGSNRRDGAWRRPAKGTMAGLVRQGIVAAAVFAAVVAIHWQLLGVYPFPQ
ncbi:MAG: NnrU family protein [Paracoccaceae bacterium]